MRFRAHIVRQSLQSKLELHQKSVPFFHVRSPIVGVIEYLGIVAVLFLCEMPRRKHEPHSNTVG
jgi:hypothetical protein